MKRAIAYFFALLLMIEVTGVASISWAHESQFTISKRAFSQHPSLKADGFTEYESPDRSYALKSASDVAKDWPLLSPRDLKNVRTAKPRILSRDGKVSYLYDRSGRESVAEYLLRHLILHIDSKDLISVHFDRDVQKVALEQNQLKIWAAYTELFEKGIEANAFNLFVRYADTEMTTISEVIYEPTIQNPQRRTQSKKSIAEMIGQFATEISGVLKSGYFPYRGVTFAEVQKNKNFISRKNVAGREIKIAGITESYEQFLTTHLTEELHKKGFNLVEAYYFGSRVMTRDVLLKLDPSIRGYMDLNKGQLIKNQVRESGLTSVSDIELFLVARPIAKAETMDEDTRDAFQLELRDQVREALNFLTRRYSLGMKILLIDNTSPRAEYFTRIQNELLLKMKWRASPEQYVKFYPATQRTPLCSQVFMKLAE